MNALRVAKLVDAAYQAGPAYSIPDGLDAEYVVTLYANDAGVRVGKLQFNDVVPYGFVCRSKSDPGDVLVAIRGTAKIIEWIDDSFCGAVAFGAGHIHSGFHSIYSSMSAGTDRGLMMWSLIDALRRMNATSMTVAGHSLGGAIATLMAYDLAGQTRIVPHVVTFGSPKVGDTVFASSFNATVKLYDRYANQHDPIADLPPFGYEHCGILHTLPSTKIMLDAHSLETYIGMLA